MGSRDIIFIVLFYSEEQFREKRMQSLLIQIEILSSACVFNLKVLGLLRHF